MTGLTPLPERISPQVRLVDPDDPDAPWSFRCPVCGVWRRIDQEQYEGTVSIDHTYYATPDEPTGCTFHENIDCRQIERV